MSRFYCGACGWNYKHWREVFYPRGLPQSRWLEYYAGHFDTVEINFSFYRLPERSTFEKWSAQVPQGFVFAVKASRYLTHIKKLQEPEEPLERLLERSAGLGHKLGPILYQFPPEWGIDLGRLEHFLKMLPQNVRHVFEFRNNTWHNDEVWEMLARYGAAYCVMDSPALPRHIKTTADFSYIRMHGSGEETGGNYSREQLMQWAENVKSLLDQGDVYVYFNNDWHGYAVQNALALREMVMGAQA